MTDFENLMFFLSLWKVEWKSFKSKKYIMVDAIKAGAKYTVCVRGEVDFAFDGDGRLVGTYTNTRGSWSAR